MTAFPEGGRPIALLVGNRPRLKIRLAWKRSQAVEFAFSHSLGHNRTATVRFFLAI